MGKTRSVPSFSRPTCAVIPCHLSCCENLGLICQCTELTFLTSGSPAVLGCLIRDCKLSDPGSKTGIQYLNKADKQLGSICSHNGFITALYEPIIRFYINIVLTTKTLRKLLEQFAVIDVMYSIALLCLGSMIIIKPNEAAFFSLLVKLHAPSC